MAGDAAEPCGCPLMMAWSPKGSPRFNTLTMDLGLQQNGTNTTAQHHSIMATHHHAGDAS